MLPWLLASVFSCTCAEKAAPDAGPVDAGPLALEAKEPDDGPERATLIPGNAVVQANLGADPAKPDEDWFVFQSALPATVDVQVTCPPGADLVLEVVDESRHPLAVFNGAGVGVGERLPNLNVSGKAFLKVSSAKKGAGGSYALTAVFNERVPGFELEPNDRKVDATSAPLGQSVSGFLAHASDQDWYRFELFQGAGEGGDSGALPVELDAGAAEVLDAAVADAPPALDAGPLPAEPQTALRIELSALEGVAYEVSLLSEAEAVLFTAKSRPGAPLSLRNVGVRSADRVIYVVVKSAWVGTGKEATRGANPSSYYTLTLAEEEAGASAELEPNDEPNKATPVPIGSYREGFLAPKGDVDYFKVDAPTPSLAKVHLSGVEALDLVLSAVAPADDAQKKPEETLLKANEGGPKEEELLQNVACSGTCWFKVEGAMRKVDGKWVKDAENATVPYRIQVTLSPDDGSEEKEPNQSATTANPLKLSMPVRGTVYPKKDVDYFLVDLSGQPVKTALKATLTGILKVDVGLYAHRLADDGTLSLVQTADSAKGDRPEVLRFTAEPGRYVFEVRDSKNREANFQDTYQLTVEADGD